jgi:hypothetical protein
VFPLRRLPVGLRFRFVKPPTLSRRLPDPFTLEGAFGRIARAMNVAQMAAKSSPAPLPYTQVESAFNTKYGRWDQEGRPGNGYLEY